MYIIFGFAYFYRGYINYKKNASTINWCFHRNSGGSTDKHLKQEKQVDILRTYSYRNRLSVCGVYLDGPATTDRYDNTGFCFYGMRLLRYHEEYKFSDSRVFFTWRVGLSLWLFHHTTFNSTTLRYFLFGGWFYNGCLFADLQKSFCEIYMRKTRFHITAGSWITSVTHLLLYWKHFSCS